jgi:hypothetical protein
VIERERQTSPLRPRLPTPPHRLKLREATSDKPGGYIWRGVNGEIFREALQDQTLGL